MNLGKGWEKKGLLLVVVVVFIIAVYAFNPFKPQSNVSAPNQTVNSSSDVPLPFSQQTSNTTANNNTTGNTTYKISPDQAKNIAQQVYPGYSASTPLQGTIVINGTTVAVWIVTLTKSGQPTKTVYVDVNSGNIISQT